MKHDNPSAQVRIETPDGDIITVEDQIVGTDDTPFEIQAKVTLRHLAKKVVEYAEEHDEPRK